MSDPVVNKNAVRLIPVARPSLGEAEVMAATSAVSSGWVSLGPRNAEFESLIAEAHGRRHGVTTCSGTTALHLALASIGIKGGDLVVVPSLTMVAVPNAVLYCGATPVFVDSEPLSGNPDPAWAERMRTLQPAAIIVPHLYGVVAIDFIQECRRQMPHTPIVEDCAEAHFARCGKRPVGSLGDTAIFSFYANKVITTAGEGGIVITNDEKAAERMRSLRAHAFTPGCHFHHQGLAYGYRMTDVQAAVGIAQFHRRQDLLDRRAAIAGRYNGWLASVDWLEFPSRPAGSTWWVFPILVRPRALAMRDRVRCALAEAGVDTRTYFWGGHNQPHLRRYATDRYPVADDLAERGLYLPLWPGMTDGDVDYICDHVCRLKP